jgi:hypothetical protein
MTNPKPPGEPSEQWKAWEEVRRRFVDRGVFRHEALDDLYRYAYSVGKASLAELEARLEAAERKIEEDVDALRGLLDKNDDLLASLANHRCSGCGAGYHDKGTGPECYETVADEYAAETKRERDEAQANVRRLSRAIFSNALQRDYEALREAAEPFANGALFDGAPDVWPRGTVIYISRVEQERLRTALAVRPKGEEKDDA